MSTCWKIRRKINNYKGEDLLNHKIQGKLLFISSDLNNRNMTAELYYTTVLGYSTIRYELPSNTL